MVCANGSSFEDYKQKLQNAIYQYLLKHPDIREPVKQEKEPLDFVQKAQTNWERRIFKSLNNMCNDLGIALSRKRPVSEQKELEAKWTELGTEDMDLSRFRPVYSPRDFLEVLMSVRNPNLSQVSIGVDHCLQPSKLSCMFPVLESYQAPLAREYSKQGCPQNLRAEMWALILGVETTDASRLQFEHLKASVFLHDLIVDKLIFKDINLTASNDDQYFVFEDLLYQILLVFSRDTAVLDHFEYSSANPPKAHLRGGRNNEDTLVIYPPNGVIPFHGFSMFVCPLCYIYEDPVTLYMVFRELYTLYFYLLHTVSSHPQGILSLCLLFETLLHELDPHLTYHMASKEIQPLKVVIKWLMRAFSGYLSADQILLLWDRILAYNSLEILAGVGARMDKIISF
ncbi:TBC1D19 [Cordylochernes scorpioides]|uniref:TBC1D19 n=1 Tax=Cordylochernes scorpioides TaxID=51811 RepID=A0ABY6LU30_9ARAC|nr:TBC1D19 [Cordylochernes scorpioides]